MEIALERITRLGDGLLLKLSKLGLTELPPLPPTLMYLYCYKNALTSLQPLPPTLEFLSCSDNAITELPPLPSTLKYLYCHNNPIVYPPPEVLKNDVQYIRKWMEENPLTFVKSANKV
jgi:Leucine-rich repeat (LRR) protein